MSSVSTSSWVLNTYSFLTTNNIVNSSGSPSLNLITTLFVVGLATVVVVHTRSRLFQKFQRSSITQERTTVVSAGPRPHDEELTRTNQKDLNKDRQTGGEH